MIQQLRVRLENAPGSLARMVKTLAEAKVDMKALELSVRGPEFGEASLIVSNLEVAANALRAADHQVEVEAAICVEIDDRVGGLAPVLSALEVEAINVHQLYAFVSRVEKKSLAVLMTSDQDKTQELLQRKGFSLLSETALADDRGPDDNDPLVDHLGVDFIW